jgi:DNA-binding winged helix-turn-helix (wHTH) protein
LSGEPTIQTCGPSLFVDHFVGANRFGEFTLDLARGGFFRSGEGAKLRLKVFEVLKYLVEYPRRLIGKEELAKAIWLDNFVRTWTESSQTG